MKNSDDALKYRVSTLVRVLELLNHGVLGPEPVFRELNDVIRRNYDSWAEFSGDWVPDMDE